MRQLSGASFDLVIVLVKSFDTDAAAGSLASRLSPTTPVLSLQNGLGNGEALARHLRRNPILVGSTTFGAQKEADAVVRLTGRGTCQIGAWGNGPMRRTALSHQQPVAQLLSRSGILTSVSVDVRSVLWKKLATSAVINPLTAILKVPNGQLLEHGVGRKGELPEFRGGLREIASAVVDEVRGVAAKHDVRLPARTLLLREARRVARATGSNSSSMLRDVEQGRRTEIDSINGAVVRMGRERGVPTPANAVLAGLVSVSSPWR
jgi:2-dehydropantoate 2-reductase